MRYLSDIGFVMGSVAVLSLLVKDVMVDVDQRRAGSTQSWVHQADFLDPGGVSAGSLGLDPPTASGNEPRFLDCVDGGVSAGLGA